MIIMSAAVSIVAWISWPPPGPDWGKNIGSVDGRFKWESHLTTRNCNMGFQSCFILGIPGVWAWRLRVIPLPACTLNTLASFVPKAAPTHMLSSVILSPRAVIKTLFPRVARETTSPNARPTPGLRIGEFATMTLGWARTVWLIPTLGWDWCICQLMTNYHPPAELVGLHTLDRFLKRIQGIINELLTSWALPSWHPSANLRISCSWKISCEVPPSKYSF